MFLQKQIHIATSGVRGTGEKLHQQRSNFGLISKYILYIIIYFLGQLAVEKGTGPFHFH